MYSWEHGEGKRDESISVMPQIQRTPSPEWDKDHASTQRGTTACELTFHGSFCEWILASLMVEDRFPSLACRCGPVCMTFPQPSLSPLTLPTLLMTTSCRSQCLLLNSEQCTGTARCRNPARANMSRNQVSGQFPCRKSVTGF